MAEAVSRSRREGQLNRGLYSANRTSAILPLDYSHDIFFFLLFQGMILSVCMKDDLNSVVSTFV